jgi:hypothetical protein
MSGTWFKDGDWIPDPNEADDFGDLREIAETCVFYQLTDVELVFRGKYEDLDVAVPLK